MTSSKNIQIAKNTIYLYIRTLVVLFVTLYTSRVILEVLGVEDLGIYNVVGGIVALLVFFQKTLSNATGRFITYEIGVNSGENQLKRIFSICLTSHIIIALIVLVFGETVGLWLINNATNIPVERCFAANIVYQFSLLVFCIHIVRAPYDAVIVANENMSVYAYASILDASGRLGLVFLLKVLSGDSLIYYGFLTLVLTLILFSIYFIYVKRKYRVYTYSFIWDKDKFKEIFAFSGWTLLGSTSNTATQQGVVLLMNNFVGLIANAALGFAQQVNSALNKFIGSFSAAFSPQVIKLCAKKDYPAMHLLMCRASKFSFILAYVLALPLIVNMDFVLHLWLENVPEYTVDFCRLILICTMFDATTGVFNTAVSATGKIRNYEIFISASFLTDLCVAFTLFVNDFHPAIVFGSRIATRGILNMFIELFFCSKLIGFSLKRYVLKVVVPIFVTVACSCPLVFLVSCFYGGWLKLFVSVLLNSCIVFVMLFFVVMDLNERARIKKLFLK